MWSLFLSQCASSLPGIFSIPEGWRMHPRGNVLGKMSIPALWRCSRAVQEQNWTSTLVTKEQRWTIRRGLHKVALPKLPSYPLLVHSINAWGKKGFCFQICFLGLASHLLFTLHPTQTLQRLRQAVVGARRICQGTEAAGDILGSCCTWSLSW